MKLQKHRAIRLAWIMGCLTLGACAQPSPTIPFPLYAESNGRVTASAQAVDTARALGRGINLGNVFESPQGNGDWDLPMRAEYVDKISAAGFTTVRIPVRWSNHATTDADAIIDEAFARRIDETVDAFLARGMYVVLNVHHYRQLTGDRLDPAEARVDDVVLQLRFFKLWQQIAARYKDRSSHLLFELFNEPHGPLDRDWNDMASRALRIVRQSNPQRIVIIGPGRWNSADALAQLQLPPDPNLIVTIHDYDPFDFTHQGAEWVKPVRPLGVSCCSDEQRARIARGLEIAQAWGQRNAYPLWLGEFGAYSKAPIAVRAAYTRAVRDAAERRGINWAYWEFGAGFGAYDPRAERWRSELLEALLGK
ncbi:MAG: glycoside hydrolase family 5 [Rhodocyclales bacterium]|nr:glycoside hydrolase family 5 [Rhodocyclales bacterium]